MVHRCNPQDIQSSCLTAETRAKLDRLATLAAAEPAIMSAINQAIEDDHKQSIPPPENADRTHLKLIVNGNTNDR